MEEVPLFNPNELSKEDIYFYFTGRKEIIEDILEDLEKKTSRQHSLIIGPRGSGKTFSLLYIYYKVEDSPELSSFYIPLRFLEEHYYMTNMEDLLYWVLKNYNDIGGEIELKPRGMETYESLYDKISQVKKEGKRFLLLLDNFDKFVRNFAESEIDQRRLRRVFITEEFFVVIAAASSYFKEVEMYDKPLYRHFAPVYLKGLSLDEILELIRKRAKRDENTKILEKLEDKRFGIKIKAISEMTGGLPRVIHLLYDLISKESFLDVIKTFGSIIDRVSYYYIARLEELSRQQRKIIDAIARSDNNAASPKKISEFTGEKIGAVTGQLKKLKDLNIVRVGGVAGKRARYYSLTEYLLYIWYVMRYLKQRKHPYIVKFLELWYEEKELEEKASEYFEAVSHYATRGDHRLSYNYAVGLSLIAEALPGDEVKRKAVDGFFKLEKYRDCIEQIKPLLENVDERKRGLLYSIYAICHQKLGDLDKALEYYNKSLEINKKLGRKEGTASVYSSIGIVYRIKGDLHKALEYHNKSLKISKELGSKEAIANQYGNIGIVFQIKGDLDRALEYFNKALEINKELGSKDGMANQYGCIGNVYQIRGDLDKALEHYNKSLEICKDLGRKEVMANQYGNIGNVHRIKGDLDRALEYYNKSLKINKELGQKVSIAISYDNIGNVYRIKSDLNRALDYFTKSLEINKELGRKEGMASVYDSIGIVFQIKGNLDRALEYHNKSLEINEELGSKEGMASVYGNIGKVYQTKRDLHKALEYYNKSLKISKELGSKEIMAILYGNIGNVYQTKRDLDRALEYHNKSLEINEELGSKEVMANQYGSIGILYQTKGNLDRALEYYNKSLKINKELGMKEGMASVYGNIGIVYKIKGNLGRALECHNKSLELFKSLGSPKSRVAAIHKASVLLEMVKRDVEKEDYGRAEETSKEAIELLSMDEEIPTDEKEMVIYALFRGLISILKTHPAFVKKLEPLIKDKFGEVAYIFMPIFLAAEISGYDNKKREEIRAKTDDKIWKIIDDLLKSIGK